jgi:hypothetical protein
LPKPGIFFIKKSLEYNVKFLLIVALDAEIAHYDFQSQLSTAAFGYCNSLAGPKTPLPFLGRMFSEPFNYFKTD